MRGLWRCQKHLWAVVEGCWSHEGVRGCIDGQSQWVVNSEVIVDFLSEDRDGSINGGRHGRPSGNGDEVRRLATIGSRWCRWSLGLVLGFG